MVFNLDTAAKELDEKATEPFKFKYKRKSWTLQTAMSLDIRVLLDPANDSLTSYEQFRLLLGDEQWESFPSINVSTAELLMKEYEKYVEEREGAGLGESEPPTDS